ncbi:MAG TPA: arginine repressor [Lactobacillaceae bacterium]|jgi:transcriptional regulator of arginine metabolism
MAKSDRQTLLLQLIEAQVVNNQEQLQQLLAENGIETTQATVSRDLRELGIVRTKQPNGVLRYQITRPEANTMSRMRQAVETGLREYALQVTVAEFILVVRTIENSANALAALIDDAQLPGVVGSLAGFDTIFVTCQNAQAAQELAAEWQVLLVG